MLQMHHCPNKSHRCSVVFDMMFSVIRYFSFIVIWLSVILRKTPKTQVAVLTWFLQATTWHFHQDIRIIKNMKSHLQILFLWYRTIYNGVSHDLLCLYLNAVLVILFLCCMRSLLWYLLVWNLICQYLVFFDSKPKFILSFSFLLSDLCIMYYDMEYHILFIRSLVMIMESNEMKMTFHAYQIHPSILP